MKKTRKPAAIIIKPVPEILWQAILTEKARIKQANPLRTVVSYGEAIGNLVR